MESYRELRDRQQKEFNELPLGFAFSDKQFDEMMEKWGLDPEKDLDKIYRVPGGGFIQKKDHEHFHEVLDRHNAEMEAAKAADEDGTGFLYQMFKYELDNHEYGYTGDFEDTLDSLGLTWEEVAASPRLLKAQFIVELEPMEQTEFKMAQFKARHQEYPMWELTEKACKLYLTRMKRDRCYGKKKTGIEKMEKELRCRVSGQKLVEDAESGYKDVRELFNQFITGPKGENREIPELTQAYERLRTVMEAQVPGAKADTAITSAVYDVAIESEMQGFIYGFQLFGAVLQGCGNTRRCAGEN